ncbi:MAG: hypothetical protein AAGD25_35305, partial [Cyanobacteria bacterium P01_F01_bin.150]
WKSGCAPLRGAHPDKNNFVWVLMVSMIIQSRTGAVAAAWRKYLASILGLFSATITGLVMILGYSSIASHLNLSMMLFVTTGMMNSGGLFSIPVIIVVASISRVLRRLFCRIDITQGI